jgi:molecular chaperone IbpA
MYSNDIERFFNSTLGFHSIIRAMNETDSQQKFPPANISSYEDDGGKAIIRVDLALAGWAINELDVKFGDNKIIVEGTPENLGEIENVHYHHKGISKRAFSWQRVVPANNVINDVVFDNGILTIFISVVVPKSQEIREVSIKQMK